MGFSRTCVLEAAARWEREDGAEVVAACLQSEPTWQWDHKEELAHLPVTIHCHYHIYVSCF